MVWATIAAAGTCVSVIWAISLDRATIGRDIYENTRYIKANTEHVSTLEKDLIKHREDQAEQLQEIKVDLSAIREGVDWLKKEKQN